MDVMISLKRLLRSPASLVKGAALCILLLMGRFVLLSIRHATVNYGNTHLVLWYNPSPEIENRPKALERTFEGCPNSKCTLTFDIYDAPISNTVIFDGRKIKFFYKPYERPEDQVWVWWSNEAPSKYYETGTGWATPPFVHSFNLTMTYHRNSDIVVPYGKIIKKTSIETKNFSQIVARKRGHVLWIGSNCHTFSWREEYVNALRKWITVDVLGECGDEFKPWECGQRYIHDDCFKILNDYYFFLAFENALCEDYFTEKVFENFNYDTILVVRGGFKDNANDVLPDGTYVDASKYSTPKQLANHLHTLIDGVTKYREMLEKKHQYENVPFDVVYQDALCDLCDKVTSLDRHKISRVPNLREYFHESKLCRLPTDL